MTRLYQYQSVFAVEEYETLLQNLAVMRNDIRTQYDISLNESHHGQPSVVGVLRTRRRGRPRLIIDPQFLELLGQHC